MGSWAVRAGCSVGDTTPVAVDENSNRRASPRPVFEGDITGAQSPQAAGSRPRESPCTHSACGPDRPRVSAVNMYPRGCFGMRSAPELD